MNKAKDIVDVMLLQSRLDLMNMDLVIGVPYQPNYIADIQPNDIVRIIVDFKPVIGTYTHPEEDLEKYREKCIDELIDIITETLDTKRRSYVDLYVYEKDKLKAAHVIALNENKRGK